MKTNTLVCYSLFALWGVAVTSGSVGAAPVAAETAPAQTKDDVQETLRDGLPVYTIHGQEVAAVKRSEYDPDDYSVVFVGGKSWDDYIVQDAEVEIHIVGCAARHLAGVYQGKPFTLNYTPLAWMADFCQNCKHHKQKGDPKSPFRRERAKLRQSLMWRMNRYVPDVSMDNFMVAADDFDIFGDYDSAFGYLRLMFNVAEPVLPTDGLFGGPFSEDAVPELLFVYGGAEGGKPERMVAEAWGNPPVWKLYGGYDWQFTILMQRLQAIGVVKTRTAYLVYYDAGQNYYLYPVTGKLPASAEDVRAGSRCIPVDEMRKLVAEAIELMGGSDFLVGPPFRRRPDGESFGYAGVDWNALTPENVNAYYVFKPKLIGCETDFPIIHAVKAGEVEHVRLCIEMGADLTVKCKDNEADYDAGMTPLQIAARHGYTEIVKLLVEGGADMEHRTWQDSMTPLMLAAENGHADTVRYLLEAGANPARRCSDPGKDSCFGCNRLKDPDAPLRDTSRPDTALDFAEKNKHPECAELIRAKLRQAHQ